MTKSLYAPDELLTPGAFLAKKFGTATPSSPEVFAQYRMAEVRQFYESPVYAISGYMKTADKAHNLVPLHPFVGQAILDTCVECQRRRGFPQRIVEVKPRQVGWTAWLLARALFNAMHFNRRSLVLVDDEDVADSYSARVGTMINALPLFLQPQRRIQNLKHVLFDNPNAKDRIENPGLNASLQITVPSPMRGIPPSFAIISEYAFMDPQRQLAVTAGLLPAIPLSEHTCVIIDTTPNGYDEFYYQTVMEAMESNEKWVRRIENAPDTLTAADVFAGALGEPDHPEHGYVLAFAPWRIHEEYTTKTKETPRGELRMPPKKTWAEFLEDVGQNPKYGCEDELELRERYKCTDGRLYWRRAKIDSYPMPTQELRLLTFRQEFALTVNSAFVESGKTPFDRECLNVVLAQEREPLARGIMRRGEKDVIGIDQTWSSPWQEVRIYAGPQSDEQYAMGIDTNNSYESMEADATVAQIVRFSDHKTVATYTARVPDHILREQLFMLYRFYNNPYYAVELKGSGVSLQRTLIEMGMRHVYYWKRLDADPDETEPTKYPGWETTSKTRPMMDATLIEYICHRDPATNRPAPLVTIPDAYTLRELTGITRTNSGSLKAKPGNHDDHVDALTIAWCIMRDPYGGFRTKHTGPTHEEKTEFDRLFRGMVSPRRNRPDLAYL